MLEKFVGTFHLHKRSRFWCIWGWEKKRKKKERQTGKKKHTLNCHSRGWPEAHSPNDGAKCLWEKKWPGISHCQIKPWFPEIATSIKHWRNKRGRDVAWGVHNAECAHTNYWCDSQMKNDLNSGLQHGVRSETTSAKTKTFRRNFYCRGACLITATRCGDWPIKNQRIHKSTNTMNRSI